MDTRTPRAAPTADANRAPDRRSSSPASRCCSTVPSGSPNRLRFGLDALIGLVPGLGDVAGALVADVRDERRAKAERPVVSNAWRCRATALDGLIGIVPIPGDVFDFAFKAQTRNSALLDAQASPDRTARRSRRPGVDPLAIIIVCHGDRARRLDALSTLPLAAGSRRATPALLAGFETTGAQSMASHPMSMPTRVGVATSSWMRWVRRRSCRPSGSPPAIHVPARAASRCRAVRA